MQQTPIDSPTAAAGLPSIPSPTRTITLGGRTLTLRALRVEDHAELMRWVQARVVSLARRAAEGLPRDERIELLQAAIREASRLTLTSPDTIRVLGELEGATRLLWLCVRQEHPDLDQAALLNLLSDPSTIAETLAAMRAVNEAAAAAEAPETKTIDP